MSTFGSSLDSLGASVAGTRVAGLRHSPVLRRGLVDLVAVALLLTTGVLAFGPVFGDATGYRAAGGGAVVGAVIAMLASWRRWTALETLVVTMAAYLLLGGALALPDTTTAGVLPTLDTFHRLVLLSWQSWRDLLTVSLPAAQYDGPAVMPYLAGLVSGVVAVRLALHRSLAPWAVLAALVLLTTGILWGSGEAPLASTQGFVFAAVALGWLAWRAQLTVPGQRATFVAPVKVRSPRVRQIALGLIALLAAGAVGVGAVAVLGQDDRHVLRDDVVPPLRLKELASPLTLFRDLETKPKTKTLFTVSALPTGARIRLAAMDAYDGNVYNVSEYSARFDRAGATILPSPYSLTGAAQDVEVTIDEYRGVWLPGGGDLRGVRFSGPGAERREAGLYFNPATGTALTTVGLAKGARYRLSVVPAPLVDPAKVPETTQVGDAAMPSAGLDVQAIGEATALAGDASTPVDQLRTLTHRLQEGYFSDGTKSPSLAGHTAGRLTRLLTDPSGQMIGDDEQYAVAATLIARKLGLPARVVLGFYRDPKASPGSGPVAITGDDAHVWTEVQLRGYGWVAFDATPPDDRTPQVKDPKPLENTDPQVLPPPEVPEDSDALPPAKADADQKSRHDGGDLWGLLMLVLKTAGALALLLLPFVVITVLKTRRRRRRRAAGRTADRISGGWSELTDVAADLGTAIPRHATRGESAVILRDTHGLAAAPAVAAEVDGHVFGVNEPTADDVERVWTTVESHRASLLGSLTAWQRLRVRFSVRSLLTRSVT